MAIKFNSLTFDLKDILLIVGLVAGYGISNGTSIFTRVIINGASNTIDFRTGSGGNVWSATGTKEITFNLIIEK